MSKSMGLNMAAGTSGMLKQGHKSFEGLSEAVYKNIEAAKAISEMVSSSMGPNGMNKLVVNHLNKIIVSSDCSTLLTEYEIQHPAAKMVALAAEMQNSEYGDGSNLCVSFAGELLHLAGQLLRQGVHQSEIVSGYKVALAKTLELLPGMVSHTIEDPRDEAQLIFAVKPVIGSKQQGYEDYLSQLVAQACLTVMPDKDSGKSPSVNPDAVRVVKLMGGNVMQSIVINGMVLPRGAEGTISCVDNAKITVFGCGIESESTETSGTVLIRNADDMLNYNKTEEKALEEVIIAIANTGTTVVVSGGTISEMAAHFIAKHGLMSVKVQSKWDMRRLCATVGATALVRLGPATPEEMGSCHKVHVKEFGCKKVTIFEQSGMEDTKVATIVLRSSVQSVINDLERSCDDGIACIQHLCRRPHFVPGAGATEMQLATALREEANKTDSLDQYSIRKFGEALEVVPRMLGQNSGQDVTSLVSKLYAEHKAGGKETGVDPKNSTILTNATEHGIVDLLCTKGSAIRLATDAAITILRVDQIIMSKVAGGPKTPKPPGHDA